MRARRRTAALILAVVALVVIGSCGIGAVRLLTGGGDDGASRAEPLTAGTIPTTPAEASALSQLPEGAALEGGEVLAVDVSAHQGEIAWGSLRSAGIGAAYLKATEGVGHEDSAFSANWKGTRSAGIARGAYHYFTLCSPGAEQAASFLETVPPDDSALPPAVDLELDGACDARPDTASAKVEVDAFVAAVEEAWGRRVVVYSSWEWRNAYGLPEEVGRPAWLTSHGERPTTSWAIWQVRFDARIDGVKGDVDLDVLKTDVLVQESTISS